MIDTSAAAASISAAFSTASWRMKSVICFSCRATSPSFIIAAEYGWPPGLVPPVIAAAMGFLICSRLATGGLRGCAEVAIRFLYGERAIYVYGALRKKKYRYIFFLMFWNQIRFQTTCRLWSRSPIVFRLVWWLELKVKFLTLDFKFEFGFLFPDIIVLIIYFLSIWACLLLLLS